MKIREVCDGISYVKYGMYLVRIKGDTQNVVKLIYNTTIL
jgi:hypothetical protein